MKRTAGVSAELYGWDGPKMLIFADDRDVVSNSITNIFSRIEELKEKMGKNQVYINH